MALDFLNSTYGWAVGSGGVILKTTAGTDLGTRLWTGMTDPLFLTIVGGLVSVVVVISGGLFYRRRKRSAVQTTMIQ
jgi:LPXTG-motif cell wall-anchored protein